MRYWRNLGCMTYDYMPPVRPSKLWWLVVPLAWLAVQAVIELSFDRPTLARIHSEWGPHETLQSLILIVAFGISAWTLAGFPFRSWPWLAAWVGLATACCFYVAGEEISWGQWIFHWTTPEYWSAVNDQDETNLHNTSSWLDQKPRLLLEVGVIVGGLVIPALRRWRPQFLPGRFALIYPPSYLWVTAAIFVACKAGDALGEAMGFKMFDRVSEVNELYLYWFVMLYAFHMKRVVRALKAAATA